MLWSSILKQIALLGGLGNAPFAPGTVASIFAGIPAACLLAFAQKPMAAAIITLIFFLSCYAADETAKKMAKHDPKEVVIDELVGYLVTMLWFPITAKSLIVGLAAFRLFDIWKPWPVSFLDQKIRGGLGIVLDDVGAGIYAHALLWLTLRIWE